MPLASLLDPKGLEQASSLLLTALRVRLALSLKGKKQGIRQG